MSKPVDLELKRAFGELQSKMQESSKKILIIDSQIGMLKKVLQRVDATHREIGSLPPKTKTYEAVARMFLSTDLEDVKTNLKKRETELIARTSELEENKKHLEKNLKESEDNIREMVQQRKEQSEVK